MPLPFHPLINTWFAETYGKPTPVQEEAWPLITKGEHVLAIAPTGSGKTLTGFLAAISRFVEGAYPADRLSVLYVSPLKALNEDIRRNLILPLEGIQARFEKAGEPFPPIRVETRSGDTPQSERRRFLSLPPSVLALTPESLAIILLNPRGRQVLSSVRYVILDEIHTALGSKRGCFLSCQIDRLALVAGEFQRIALSATVKPPEAAADFAGGLRKITTGSAGGYEKRKVHIVAPGTRKEIQFQVIFTDSGESNDGEIIKRYGKRYAELIKFIIERIRAKERQGTILVFTDSRRRAERISYFLNRTAENEPDLAGRPLSYTHHGSLSKEVRRGVEKALAAGEISCVVATGSLELGIDIGSVEEVVLAGSPGSAVVALQRVGRSGHGVGMISRGWLLPFHGLDLLQAAALSGAVEEKELEETGCLENPLDILAQIILALCTEQDWNEKELYETIRGFHVYRNLSKAGYDGVIRMLAGAYEGTRLRELKRRIFRDDETGKLSAAPGLLPLLYTSGGVITSRGYYSLRLSADRTKIGELDEEFVWERRLGDCFDFGNRSWRITAIGDEAVEVVPLSTGVDSAPFWKGDMVYRSQNLSRRMLEILDGYYPKAWTSIKAENMLNCFSADARKALEDFLHSQWSCQGIPLPGLSFIPIEIVDDPESRGDAILIIFHTFRGGGVNFPLSLALARDMETHHKLRVEGTADDNTVFIRLPRSIASDPAAVIQNSLTRLSVEGMGEKCFRERLEYSGVFGAAFREAAERSLLLPRSPFGKRMPLWVTREKSRRLFDAVRRYNDFPVTAEAWRTCLLDTFNMEGFSAFLEEIRNGAVSIDFFKTKRNSPFSKELAWTETNSLMYHYDERPDLLGPPSQSGQGPSISDKVIAEALGNAETRPRLKADLIDDFCAKLRREIPGWAPEDALTLCEWVKERIAIPTNDVDEEWEKLLKCIPAELTDALWADKSLGGKLDYVRRNGASIGVVVHREWAKKWQEAGTTKLVDDCLGQWMRFQGPIPFSRIGDIFGLSSAEAEKVTLALSEEQETLVFDVATDAGTSFVCDRENLELLLRLGRRKQRPTVKERPAAFLVPYLARRQGLLRNSTTNAVTGNNIPWKLLTGITAPAKLWETEFFPSRCPSYSGEMLDREIREGRLIWYGDGKEKAAFCLPADMDLVMPFPPAPPFKGRVPAEFFDSPRSFWEIKDALSADAGISGTAQALWDEVWKGALSADSWEPLRKALENGFASLETTSNAVHAHSGRGMGRVPGTRVPKAIRERWRAGPPVLGNWFSLYAEEDGLEGSTDFSPEVKDPWDLNPLDEEELNRERLRLLLDRWGILARPLLEREAPILSWSRLLPAMRRMELAGELVAGRFFGGINSLQFASPRIIAELEETDAERGIYWMNAADPASPAGLDIKGIHEINGLQANELSVNEPAVNELSVNEPAVRRIPTTRLCFRGAELLAVSNRSGKELEVFISPVDPDISEALAFLKIPKTRRVQSESKISIEKINGATASVSAYSPALAALGFVKDRGKMVLW